MKAKDKTEDVLKSIHVLFSKAEPIEGSKKKVIIDKERMLGLLKSLNDCMYAMMDEYEISAQAKEKALRKVQKQSDEILFDARKSAEDIYAASLMYTDHALDRVREIIRQSEDDLQEFHDKIRARLEENVQSIKDNQLELKNQLASLIDTQKYLTLIENENKRLIREAEKQKELEAEWGDDEPKKIEPEIIINQDYFKAAGLLTEDDEPAIDPELSQDLDKEYFEWKEESENEDIDDAKDDEEKEVPKKGLFGLGRKS